MREGVRGGLAGGRYLTAQSNFGPVTDVDDVFLNVTTPYPLAAVGNSAISIPCGLGVTDTSQPGIARPIALAWVGAAEPAATTLFLPMVTAWPGISNPCH